MVRNVKFTFFIAKTEVLMGRTENGINGIEIRDISRNFWFSLTSFTEVKNQNFYIMNEN